MLGIQFITVLVIKVTVSTTRKFTIHSWPEIRSSKLKLSNRKVESRIYDWIECIKSREVDVIEN